MAVYRLKLQKYELQNVNYAWLTAFRLRVEASDPEGFGTDPNIFLFLRGTYNPHTESAADEYYGVASPVDLSMYPVGEPSDDTAYPFFRQNFFEIDLSSQGDFDTVWTETVAEVQKLMAVLKRMELLVPTVEVFLGDAPDEGTSGSSSSG